MTAKRTQHVMLRLTPAEHEKLVSRAPAGEELAAFARRTLLAALEVSGTSEAKRAAAFVVAALSSEIGFEEALRLFDEHVPTEE